MKKYIRLTNKNRPLFKKAVQIMAEFRRIFSRSLGEDFLAELHLADRLKLKVCGEVNKSGYDAVDNSGKRYQIKYRDTKSQNVDVNNFNFDHVLLVNLGSNYELMEVWEMDRCKAKKVFKKRAEFRKWQVSQKKFKVKTKRLI
jgi:hypothetical protein